MRSNLEGARLYGNIIAEKNRYLQVQQTLGGNLTMGADFPHLLWLNPGAANRDILLPPEAKGLWFLIVNQATTSSELVVKDDSGASTVGVVTPGQGVWFFCDGTSWFAFGAGGAGAQGVVSPVLVPVGASYAVLPQNSGRVHIVPDMAADCTITLPTPDEGLAYRFVYGGVAADASNHIFTGGAGNFLKGSVLMADTDAGAAADEMSVIYGDGSSHVTLTVNVPGNYAIDFYCDGALWYVDGRVGAATVAAFS